jgi:hypothetical protein
MRIIGSVFLCISSTYNIFIFNAFLQRHKETAELGDRVCLSLYIYCEMPPQNFIKLDTWSLQQTLLDEFHPVPIYHAK